MNISKQIAYWESGAEDALDTAKILIEKNKILHGLFFCHLCLEKILKAIVVKETEYFAPKTHNLFYLLKKGNILLKESDYEFIAEISVYQLEGRYPETDINLPDKNYALDLLIKTERIFKCLKRKLSIN